MFYIQVRLHLGRFYNGFRGWSHVNSNAYLTLTAEYALSDILVVN